MHYCKMTICFEAPFWIALIETEDPSGNYRVAKHTFGPEPSDPEVGAFIHDHRNELRFTAELQVEKVGGKKINHKRMQRIIAKEIAANVRSGTKAQQALAEEREATALERKQISKEQHEAQKQAKFDQRSEKRKQKHRGH